jgi:hypothetical protein
MPAPQIINLSDSTPAAPTGRVNVHWQADSSAPRNVSASVQSQLNGIVMWVNGPLSVNADATNHLLMPSTKTFTPTGASAEVKTAPTGSSLVATINVNGSPWLTFTFAAGSTTASATPTGTIAAGDVVSLAITAIGSTVAGSDLSLSVFN